MPYTFYGTTAEDIAAELIELAGEDLPLALEIRQEIREKEALNEI